MHAPQVVAAALAGWAEVSTAPADSEHVNAACLLSCETLPLAEFVALTERRAREIGDEQLGWQLGVRHDLRGLGPIHEAVLSSPTLGEAMHLLVESFCLVQESSELDIVREDGCYLIRYRILDPAIWPRHQDAIFTLGVLSQLVRLCVPGPWDKVQMGVEMPSPEVALRLAQRTGIACIAGAGSNFLRLPMAFAHLPMPARPRACAGDSRALRSLVVQQRRQATAESRVRSLVYRQLGEQPISQERIARQLGMSSRTLRRQLAAASTSFQALVDDCRLRQAAHEFRVRRNVSIAQTALRLGYSEHSTFTRAFSRWSGMPPHVYIRTHGIS